MGEFDFIESDEFLGDEAFREFDVVQKPKKGQARRRYDRLMEEKRLKRRGRSEFCVKILG